VTAPTSSGDDEIRRELERQSGQSALLATRLADMQAQLRRSPPGPLVVPSPPAPSSPWTPAPSGSAAATDAPPEPDPASTPESQEALSRGRELLDDAISSHRWTSTEVAELRQLLADMSGPHRLEIMRSLAAALNRGDFKGTLSSLVLE
jgi:hypothetical protein